MSYYNLDHLLTTSLFAELEDARTESAGTEEASGRGNTPTAAQPPSVPTPEPQELPARKLPAWGNHVAPLGLVLQAEPVAQAVDSPPPLPIEERVARDFLALEPPAAAPRSRPEPEPEPQARPAAEPTAAVERLVQAAQAIEAACARLNQVANRLLADLPPQPALRDRLYQTSATPGGGRPGVVR